MQTGRAPEKVARSLERAEQDFLKREEKGSPPLDLAFFGGTFTALPPRELRACLDFALRWKERGQILELRCSTRPDALSPSLLASLKAGGFSLVELGVQSFQDEALARSRRAYDGSEARKACALVLASGLELGIQLMPGMPGATPESALEDADIAASFSPACARLYPCLVLAGAPLAQIWEQGLYRPWTIEQAVELLALATRSFWRAGVPVIRTGLAPEAGLEANILAGPYHPGLGGMVRGRALQGYLQERIQALADKGRKDFLLFAPRGWQGAFWGERGALEGAYAALGLTRKTVRWWDRDFFALGESHFPGRGLGR